MPSIATPVVHGNRLLTPLAPSRTGSKVKPETVRCGRGIGREGAAPPPCQRPPQNARRKALRKSNAFRQAPFIGPRCPRLQPPSSTGTGCSPPAPSRTGSKVKTGNSPVRKGDRSGGGCAPSLPKTPAKCPQESPAQVKRFQAVPFIGPRCPRLQPPSSMGTALHVECHITS